MMETERLSLPSSAVEKHRAGAVELRNTPARYSRLSAMLEMEKQGLDLNRLTFVRFLRLTRRLTDDIDD